MLFLVGGASPLLAGVALAGLPGGVERIVDLRRRLVDVRRVSLRWWSIILAFWPVFDLLMALAAAGLGVVDRPLQVRWQVLVDPAAIGFLVVLSFVFPAVEEVGLRGTTWTACRSASASPSPA